MVLQHNSVGKSLLWHVMTIILFNTKVQGYIVIPLFISCFTTFYCLDPYFIFEFIIFNVLVCYYGYSYDNYAHVTVSLKYGTWLLYLG